MSRTPRTIWIDDNPGRESTANDLNARFINVRGRDLAPEIQKLLEGKPPRLVILDHVLDKTQEPHPLFMKGSTIAEAIKEKWPYCPVVGVTNADLFKDIDFRTKQTYDAVFPFQDFGNYIARIKSIARGFAVVSKQSGDIKDLISTLKPPESDFQRLIDALSWDLKKDAEDASVGSRFYRWVETLVARPGFLYDDLWSATFLGLNEAGFRKVNPRFQKAAYAGIFARASEPRWWATRLAEILYRLSPAEPGELSWNAGRRLPGVRRQHFSICYYCKDEFPETVAYLDEESDQRRAMHLKCTVLHPRFKRELYFEDIRMMSSR